MHEHHAIENGIKIVENKAKELKAKRVTKISVVLGPYSSFKDDSVKFYFESLGKGRIIEGAKVEIKRLKAEAKCEKCGHVFSITSATLECPKCGGPASISNAGKEFYIEDISIER